MPCNYSYLQENFYKRFDGAVSKTVLLKEFDNKVKGSSPDKTFFLLSHRCRIFFCDLHVCRKACFDVFCTCKATSLSKMAKFLWRYSDKYARSKMKVWNEMKLSLNRVWGKTAAPTGVSRSTA